MHRITTRFSRRWPALMLVLAAFGVAACGSGGGSSSAPAASSTPAATTSTSSPSSQTTSSNKIPQGPNAGDADSDNQGAPSDGDGNL